MIGNPSELGGRTTRHRWSSPTGRRPRRLESDIRSAAIRSARAALLQVEDDRVSAGVVAAWRSRTHAQVGADADGSHSEEVEGQRSVLVVLEVLEREGSAAGAVQRVARAVADAVRLEAQA